jgi:hypothetical protein
MQETYETALGIIKEGCFVEAASVESKGGGAGASKVEQSRHPCASKAKSYRWREDRVTGIALK